MNKVAIDTSRNDVLDYRGKPRVQTVNTGPELTVQNDRQAADINVILRKYKQTGIVDSLRNADMIFKDVSEFTDLTDAFGQARVAEKAFMKLPSKVREVFNHDVAQWLDAAHDPEKINELVAKGIIEDPQASSQVAGSTQAPAPPAPTS